MTDYSEISCQLTKQLSKSDKKNSGIYFTPPKTIAKNLEVLKEFMPNIKSVLEPSCGSCEFITQLNSKHKNLEITGLELNKTIFNSIKHKSNNNIKIYNKDFLTHSNTNKYDLILGNPPYFVMKKHEVDKHYYDYFTGRPNIFILFIIKSLELLKSDGILSFVLPKKFLTCSYYEATRTHINDNFKIISIMSCDDHYIETQQETIIIIIQNKQAEDNNSKFIFDKYTVFGLPETIIKLNELCANSTTLSDLNFTVNIGNVVWNQQKYQLQDEKQDEIKKTEQIRLIYSGNIVNNKLENNKFKNSEKTKKKNFISLDETEYLKDLEEDFKEEYNYLEKTAKVKDEHFKKQITDKPMLLINRGYGAGNYKLDYCLIKGGFKYLVENHLICVKNNETKTDKELIELYEKIITSFNNPKTTEFIDLYCSNNINTIELCKIMPIYL